ncbi:B9 domain-containing protein 1-like isoform X2 [Panonychus citri]|uniref:B9 domain-containing protein 1-like isoform X2 n=1 Tax=Panonychus citri TaxID=50023 RepID=UPI00230831E6|nr:B9 domain-containing protein 1-like isoform X2 [Panonychus citri]
MEETGDKVKKESKRDLAREAMEMTSANFLISVKGQVVSGHFPGKDNIYCKYCFLYGEDWMIINGNEESCSQVSIKTRDSRSMSIWNLSIDVTFRSSNPFKWPLIVLSVYGYDSFGNDVVLGYGSIHIPPIPGHHQREIPAFVPQSSSLFNSFSSWIFGKQSEFIDSKIVGQSEDRGVIKVNTKGVIKIEFDVICKDFQKYGYRYK